jgi:hypothetical protein
MTVIEFKENLGLKIIPAELEELIIFQSGILDRQYYSDGFEIILDSKGG